MSLPLQSGHILVAVNNITFKKIEVYLTGRYLALFISALLTPLTLNNIIHYPYMLGVIICCFFIALNLSIYNFYKKFVSSKCGIVKYLLERFLLNIIFLFTLIIFNFLCLYYLHSTFIETYIAFISGGGLFFDILYSTGGNFDNGFQNMAGSSNTNSTPGGPGGNGGGNNGGGNNGGNNHLAQAHYTRYNEDSDEDIVPIYNPNANPYFYCAAALKATAVNVILERGTDDKVNRIVTLEDVHVTAFSPYYPLLYHFARQYRGDESTVTTFCSQVRDKKWYASYIVPASNTKVLEAISKHIPD